MDTKTKPAFEIEKIRRTGPMALPTWQLRFDPVNERGRGFQLELSQEVVFGASPEADGYKHIRQYDLHELGVSRRHAKLWPTSSQLFITDLGSTNGTWLNGRRLESDHPYTINDGDVLSLGKLEFYVKVVKQPDTQQGALNQRIEMADALAKMAKAITSQLELDAVLDQALEMAMADTNAREVSVWLHDEQKNELFLVAERGIEDERIRRMRLPVTDNLVAQVFETGRPLRAHREGEMVKVKTGYLVEALLYVPLIHGSQTLGVMAAAHRDPSCVFSPYDERLLGAIADFAAIALHNARLYERVQNTDRLKTEMIQNISHEFRSPLTYIVGYTGLLLEEREKLSDEQRRSLEVISLQADKLVWLVKNFVALQPLEDLASIRGESDMNQVLETIIDSVRLHANEKKIDLKLDAEPDLPPVAINRMALLQIMDNLLSNAIKFTPDGGKVTVEAQLNEKKQVVISVRDTGIGIAKKDQERIFERFVQLEGGMSRQYGGVGLGLAVCKALIEACGQTITVESEPSKGSTFTFSLPVVA